MKDSTIKKIMSILSDALVKVKSFISRTYFLTLDCKVDLEVTTILERLFLAKRKVLVEHRDGTDTIMTY